MNKILLFIVYLFPIIIILTYKNKNKYMFTLIYILTVSSIFSMNTDMNDNIQAIKYKNDKIKIMMSINNINKKTDDKKNTEKKIVSKQEIDENINFDQENLEKKVQDDNSHVQVINIDKTNNKNLNKDQIEVVDSLNNKADEENEEVDELKVLNDFEKEVQDIEKKGLVPLRKCYGVLKKMQKGKADMNELMKEAQNSRQKCDQVELMYRNLKVPEFKDEENTKLLKDAKLDIQKAFYIRKKAMDYGIEFLDNKNPKYIIKIKDSLKLSDKLVHSFTDNVNKIKSNLKK
ncbi:conserved protein of unknown function [Tepidibacter aestuarii]|nr:conserved protein of unknown function [Tepidibacter aestuarii]